MRFPQPSLRNLFLLGAALLLAASPASAAGGETLAPLQQQIFDLLARSQAARAARAAGEPEEVAILWEIDGEAYCAYTPPEGLENAFQFDDRTRWQSSATNAGPLGQGDPMTLTWSFIPDGPQGAGFTCGVDGEVAGAPSNFIAFMDGLHGAGPGGADLTMRPWFPIFSSAFANWGALNGINYVYEPMDDGASAGQGGAPGMIGVRGDLRIGGKFLDGQAGPSVLACNYFPNNGDMIFDTGNTNFYSPAPPEHRGFRNVIEHEHGHGLAFRHVCPLNQTKLMEPFVSTMFLGAQEDDVLAANRGYGDRDEFPGSNDTSGTATSLGAITPGNMVMRTRLSVDGTSDQDFYSFAGPAGGTATITVKPTGTTYLQGPQTAACDNTGTANFNALVENNLGVELRGLSGANVLATANSAAAGVEEKINEAALSEGAGTYFVRVFGAQDRAQMYDLTVSVAATGADVEITKTDSPDPVFPGAKLTYTIAVKNNGPATASGVVVTETLPGMVGSPVTAGCTEDPNGTPTCTLGDIAPGATKTYTVTVTNMAGAGAALSNKVDVATTSTDTNAANNTFTEMTTVANAPSCLNDINLTSANNGTASGYGAKNSITTGGGFTVGAMEKVNLTAGSTITAGNDTSIAGEAVFVNDPTICP